MGLMFAAIASGPPGSLTSDPERLRVVYAEHPNPVLVAIYLGGLAWCGAFVVHVTALHHLLHARHDEGTAVLANVGLAGGVVNAALIASSLVFGALAVSWAGLPERFALAREASLVANAFTGFATAVCTSGFSPALRRIGFPRWLVVLGVAVALHHLASAAALAASGAWSPGGSISMTAPLGMTLWVGAVAALTWQRRDRV